MTSLKKKLNFRIKKLQSDFNYRVVKLQESLKIIVTSSSLLAEVTIGMLMTLSYLASVSLNLPVEESLEYPRLTLHAIGVIGIIVLGGALTISYGKLRSLNIRSLIMIISVMFNFAVIRELGEASLHGTNVFWVVLLFPNMFSFLSTFIHYYKLEKDGRRNKPSIRLYIRNHWAAWWQKNLGHDDGGSQSKD